VYRHGLVVFESQKVKFYLFFLMVFFIYFLFVRLDFYPLGCLSFIFFFCAYFLLSCFRNSFIGCDMSLLRLHISKKGKRRQWPVVVPFVSN